MAKRNTTTAETGKTDPKENVSPETLENLSNNKGEDEDNE